MTGLGSDPGGGGALTAAVQWVAGVLLGPAGTIVAILTVASLGFLMLWGRLPMRRGFSVVVGCFILFSAGGVASGLMAAATRPVGAAAESVAAAQPTYKPTTPKPEAYDPYSGAAVPDQGGATLLD